MQALTQIARGLIGHGADLTGCVDQAIYSNNLEVFEMLLKAGRTCTDDDTLNHAACDGQFDALELLKYGGKLDGTRGTDHHGGYTPLGCTVSCRSIQGTRWFLEKGQNPNKIKSKDGENCLHMAVHFGASDKMLQLLIDYGAEINQKDKQRRTPLARAREKNHKKAVAFLEAAGAKA
jgi:ankyrin repeat protein